jgi:hypothetical protein
LRGGSSVTRKNSSPGFLKAFDGRYLLFKWICFLHEAVYMHMRLEKAPVTHQSACQLLMQ